jgi:peptidoglycan/LPS O-acetylase OafA/YrhL
LNTILSGAVPAPISAPGIKTACTPEMQPSEKRSFPGVRGVRFFAALLVVSYHLRWFDRDVTVSFFFVLSGFILCFSRIHECTDFYKRRFLRIYPMYLLGLVLGIPGMVYHFNGFGGLILPPLLLQAWVPSCALIWNGPGWSISCLAFFYLLMPLLVRRPAATGIFIALLPVALCLPGVYSRLPIVNLPQFCVGVMGGLCFKKRARISWLIPAVTCIAVVIFVPLPQIALHNGILAPLFLWLILSLTEIKSSPRWILLLGDSSYALLILHYPIMFAFKAAMSRASMPPLIASAYLVVAVVSSLLAFRFVDPWLRTAVQRVFFLPLRRPFHRIEIRAGAGFRMKVRTIDQASPPYENNKKTAPTLNAPSHSGAQLETYLSRHNTPRTEAVIRKAAGICAMALLCSRRGRSGCQGLEVGSSELLDRRRRSEI